MPVPPARVIESGVSAAAKIDAHGSRRRSMSSAMTGCVRTQNGNVASYV